MSCERLWELDALREGRLGAKDAESFARHQRACGECRAQGERDAELWELARALPDDAPDEVSMRRLRARVLRDVATGVEPRGAASRRAVVVGAAVATAVALVAGGARWHRAGADAGEGSRASQSATASGPAVAAVPPSAPADETFAGEVHPSGGAQWTQVRAERVERVLLGDGTVQVHVRHQEPGERFLVALPDGEVEVRGTTFDVTVAGGVTQRVDVQEGVVEVRIAGLPQATVGAAGVWTHPVPAVSATSAPPSTPSVALASALSPAPGSAPAPVPTVDDDSDAYVAAVQLLRAGRAAEAATAFGSLLASHPSGAHAEDASYLEAVALARAGRADAAALAAEQHLSRFPGSFHAKDASILVARAAAARGDCAKARAVLTSWPDAQATLAPCADK